MIICLLIVHELERGGFELTAKRVDTAEETEQAFKEEWDIVICDHAMGQFSSTAALAFVQNKHVDTPFVIVSGMISEEVIRKALATGARDCISKNNLGRIVPRVKIIATSGLAENAELIKARGTSVDGFLQKPYSAQKLLKMLYDVLPSQSKASAA